MSMNLIELTQRVSTFEQRVLCVGDFDVDDMKLIKRLLDETFPELKWSSRHYEG